MTQAKCKVEGCPRTAIPGKSPHGLCLKHEAELAAHPRCNFPGCQATPWPGQSPNGCCQKHEQFIKDLCFILPHIQWAPVKLPAASPAAPKPEIEVSVPAESAASVLPKNENSHKESNMKNIWDWLKKHVTVDTWFGGDYFLGIAYSGDEVSFELHLVKFIIKIKFSPKETST